MSEPRDRSGVIAPPPLVFAIPLIAGIWLQNHTPFLQPMMWKITGAIFASLGALLVSWAELVMSRRGTPANPYRAVSAIVGEGPYEFTRNPMYVSMTLFYIGVSIFFGSWLALALLPLALIVIRFGVIAREERYLERKFGDAYLDYKRRVRRWL